MEIIEERMRQRNHIIEEVTEFVKGLNFTCTVLLIGSYARGDFNLWSDVDILIIGNFEGNPVQRLKNLDLPAGYEAILLTPEEVRTMMKRDSSFVMDFWKEGVMIRDDMKLSDILRNE